MLMGLHSSIGVRFSRGRLLFSYTYHEPEKIFKKLIWITVTTPTQTQLTQPQPKITKAGFGMKMTPPQLEKNTTFFPFFPYFYFDVSPYLMKGWHREILPSRQCWRWEKCKGREPGTSDPSLLFSSFLCEYLEILWVYLIPCHSYTPHWYEKVFLRGSKHTCDGIMYD